MSNTTYCPARSPDQSDDQTNCQSRDDHRRIADWNGPGTGFAITGAISYWDTIGFDAPWEWFDLLPELRRQHPDMCRPKKMGDLYRQWWRFEINQPTRDEIIQLAAIKQLKLMRADVAIDFLTPTADDADRATAFLDQHVVLKWNRGNQLTAKVGPVSYWAPKGAGRNAILYGDRLSKANRGHTAHLELRFLTAAACRRANLRDFIQLLDVDPSQLLQHNTKLSPINYRKLFRKYDTAQRLSRFTAQELSDRGIKNCFGSLPWSDLSARIEWWWPTAFTHSSHSNTTAFLQNRWSLIPSITQPSEGAG